MRPPTCSHAPCSCGCRLYYVGLLGGLDDTELFRRTGQGRDVNRHTYTPAEIDAALESAVTRAQLGLVRVRRRHPAFDGEFRYWVDARDVLHLEWTNRDARAALAVSFAPEPAFRLRLETSEETREAASVDELAEWGAPE